MKRRIQCEKCPWRTDVDPRDIPNGYCELKHQNLKSTIAERAELLPPSKPLRIMACHESKPGKAIVCVGWLHNQLGPGNNIPVRLAMSRGTFPAFELVGEQHERFEDTLPDDDE
jgi:hypothetical protein